MGCKSDKEVAEQITEFGFNRNIMGCKYQVRVLKEQWSQI